MSQVIVTKFIGPTNTKGGRYKASCQRGSLTVSERSELSPEKNHVFACAELCRKFAREDMVKYKTLASHNPWLKRTVSGQLPDGTVAHVFVS